MSNVTIINERPEGMTYKEYRIKRAKSVKNVKDYLTEGVYGRKESGQRFHRGSGLPITR